MKNFRLKFSPITCLTILSLTSFVSIQSSLSMASEIEAKNYGTSALSISERLKLRSEKIESAAKSFIATVPEDQHEKLIFPFDSAQRFSGRDTKNTESFCAVLAWCEPWGMKQGDMNQEQLQAMHKLLNATLSTGGYQTFLALMNRHRILGEVEDVATADFMKVVEEKCPDIKGANLQELKEKCPEAPEINYVSLAGAKTPTNGEYDLTWIWEQDPGFEKRRKQFDDFSIAIFGEVGAPDWSIRFEGHHATLNVHLHTDPETGAVSVANTPLFFGSSPVIIPTDPDGDTTKQWNWTKGQMLMYATIDNIREFWLALPEETRDAAFIDKSNFKQHGHLSIETFEPWLMSAIEPSVDADRIEQFKFAELETSSLSPAAIWRLEQTFQAYLSSMSSSISDQYQNRINEALKDGDTKITIAWAGGDLADKGSQHFSHIQIGDLLLEFQQSNQWSAQHDPKISGNHVHSMLRDLSYDWDYNPLAVHMKTDPHEHGHDHGDGHNHKH